MTYSWKIIVDFTFPVKAAGGGIYLKLNRFQIIFKVVF